MGNMNSNLGIQIDQDAVYSGGTISGKVFLQVTSETEAATLQIMFVGKEHAHVHWTTTEKRGDRQTTRHHHAYRDRTLVAIDVPLGTFPDGVVRPGNYEFPFSATLPAGLPTAMAARGDGGSGADCTMIERVAVVSHLYHDGLCSRAFSVYVTLQSPPSPRAAIAVGSPAGSVAENGNS